MALFHCMASLNRWLDRAINSGGQDYDAPLACTGAKVAGLLGASTTAYPSSIKQLKKDNNEQA